MFMTTALTGTTIDARHQEQQDERGEDDDQPAAEREPGGQLAFDVGELGGGPTDLGVERRSVVADPLDQRRRPGALGGPGGDEVDDGEAGRRARAGRCADDAVGCDTSAYQAWNVGSVASTSAMTVTGSVPRAGNRSARVEVGGPDLGGAGQRPRVAVLEAGVEERGAQEHQDQRRRGADDDRAALDPTGEPVEAALVVGAGGSG